MHAAVATAERGPAEVTTEPAKLHVFYRYGLDATRIRVDRVARIERIDARPYVREQDPGDGSTGYLLVTLTVENPGSAPENVPLFATSVTMSDGHTIDPAVYGPFIGSAMRAAPASTTIRPRARVVLRFAIADIPNGRSVASIVFNPNDATAQFRFSFAPHEIAPLPAEPRR